MALLAKDRQSREAFRVVASGREVPGRKANLGAHQEQVVDLEGVRRVQSMLVEDPLAGADLVLSALEVTRGEVARGEPIEGRAQDHPRAGSARELARLLGLCDCCRVDIRQSTSTSRRDGRQGARRPPG